MFVIRFATANFAPDLDVTMRSAADGFQRDVPGTYEAGSWVFRLDENDFPNPLAFKFVLERTKWMLGDNLVVHPAAGAEATFGEDQVAFEALGIVAESGRVTRQFFQPNHDEAHEYDVVVVGSGAGGGMVASRLVDRGADVLVVEAGPYLFPTHVANLPRRLRPGRFDKHVWGLWDEFSYATYENVPGSQFAGQQSFNLGGRSLFWGGLIPELGVWELEQWPEPVRDYLLGPGFPRAHQALNSTPVEHPFQDQVMAFLGQALPDYTHRSAPVAVQYRGVTPSAIPTGMFSTADLLLQHRLAEGGAGTLTANLNHAVWKVLTEGNRAVGVQCDDLLSHTPRTYKARAVVLAAGTIESAKIALQSGLHDPSGLLGHGITDHTILFRHFSLPAGSPFAEPGAAAKVWSRPTDEQRVREVRFNAVLELGADFNQGRYVNPEHLRRHQEAKGGSVLCEVVFLFETALGADNLVALNGPPASPVLVRVDRMPIPEAGRVEAERVTELLFQQLGAEPIFGEPLHLQEAPLGAVAHEVGTLRMGAVVDADLRFAAYENLYACDNSVLPTSPAANPTLALTALALRLGDHLATP